MALLDRHKISFIIESSDRRLQTIAMGFTPLKHVPDPRIRPPNHPSPLQALDLRL